MSAARAFRKALADGDYRRVQSLWATVYPNMPGPTDEAEAEIVMHIARTHAESLPLAARLYSHAWVRERGFTSHLPQELRPKGERAVPIVVPAVGVSVGTLSRDPGRRERAKELERVMAKAGGDMIAAGITDPARVSAHMWQAREDFIRRIPA